MEYLGGSNGKRGQNLLIRKDGLRIVNLGGKTSVDVEPEVCDLKL